MTKYTADDFSKVRFATRNTTPLECRAVAHSGRDGRADRWIIDCSDYPRSDDDMVHDGWVPMQEPRPLTPDAITDEMVERGKLAFYQTAEGDLSLDVRVRRSLTAALTPDPQRPEGAEEIERLIREANREGDGVADKLADRLASRGVRVVTEGKP